VTHPFHVPAGATIRFGAPAYPLPEDARSKIGRGLSSIQGVIEAHLPLCQVVGAMTEPVQVLVVVFEQGTALQFPPSAVIDVVRTALPQGSHLDVWPVRHDDPLLATVRKANCCLFGGADSKQGQNSR
jgi:hypothetical protein